MSPSPPKADVGTAGIHEHTPSDLASKRASAKLRTRRTAWYVQSQGRPRKRAHLKFSFGGERLPMPGNSSKDFFLHSVFDARRIPFTQTRVLRAFLKSQGHSISPACDPPSHVQRLRPRFRSQKSRNPVRNGADPTGIDRNCEPYASMRPSCTQGLACF